VSADSAQRTSFALCLALVLWAGDAFATPEDGSRDNFDSGNAEVFVSYVYQTGHPPNADALLRVAREQCKRSGYADAIRSTNPTLKQCIGTSGAVCMREMGTASFDCTSPPGS
jgi:hypothetical protein